MGKSKVNLYQISNSSSQIQRIREVLILLDLEGINSSFETLSKLALKKDSLPLDFLETLLEKEISWKEGNRIERWIQQARFPWKKTLEDFDFSFQPTIDRKQIYEFASCRFIERAENIIFLGPPGVGKTHLAIALGLKAIQKGKGVKFVRLDQLIDLVDKATDAMSLRRLFGTFMLPNLLIIDEMDFYETNLATGTFLFKLLQQRYEKGSVIFTSNKSFDQWGKIFGSHARTLAIIDRIAHHGEIVNIEGESYRIKDKIKQVQQINPLA